jgi:hypothetical protein
MSKEVDSGNLEQVARSIGERWARRVLVETRTAGQRESSWPCGLDEARKLIDETLGRRISGDRVEALAIIVERSARATWYESSRRK